MAACIAGCFTPAQAECVSAPFVVRGQSLAPQLADGATLMGQVGDCGDPARGELLLFVHHGARLPLLKRVIGVPGDRFGVREAGGEAWSILINGMPATNTAGVPYRLNRARAARIGIYAKGAGGVIPPNAWLVMGESPAGSDDSSRYGLITRPALRGKASPPRTISDINSQE